MKEVTAFISDLEQIKKCLGPMTDNKTRDLIIEKITKWEKIFDKHNSFPIAGYDDTKVDFGQHETTTSIDKNIKITYITKEDK
jgi:hypothetical protein